ncbi:MAG: Fe-S protein assembly co-chaperone HscB [Alphaproteobacteria bacterium]
MINHFFNLNLAENFVIDLNILEKNYLELQQKFHPDQSLSDLEKSIALNESYKILSNPISRAEHLLELKNIFINDDENSLRPSLETLNEVIELQEKIENCQNLAELSPLKNLLLEKIDESFLQFINNFNIKNFAKSAQDIMKIKYFKKTLELIKNKSKAK